jgi:hypothetical protein
MNGLARSQQPSGDSNDEATPQTRGTVLRRGSGSAGEPHCLGDRRGRHRIARGGHRQARRSSPYFDLALVTRLALPPVLRSINPESKRILQPVVYSRTNAHPHANRLSGKELSKIAGVGMAPAIVNAVLGAAGCATSRSAPRRLMSARGQL